MYCLCSFVKDQLTIFVWVYYLLNFPCGSDGKERTCNARNPEFDPWVRKIPWRRDRLPTPVFLPGKSNGQRSLVGYIGLHRIAHTHIPGCSINLSILSAISCNLDYCNFILLSIFSSLWVMFSCFTYLTTFYSVIDIVYKRAAETEANVYKPRRDFAL